MATPLDSCLCEIGTSCSFPKQHSFMVARRLGKAKRAYRTIFPKFGKSTIALDKTCRVGSSIFEAFV